MTWRDGEPGGGRGLGAQAQGAAGVGSPLIGTGNGVIAGMLTRPEPRIPDPGMLEDAAEVLDRGTRIAILVDQGARGASRRVVELAEVLGAGVAKTPLGRSVLPDSLPYVTGCIGLLGTQASQVMLSACDTVLRVGTLFPYAEWLPSREQARLVEIDTDPWLAGSTHGAEVHLVGDAERTLRALLTMVEQKADRSWRSRIEHEVAIGRTRDGISSARHGGRGLAVGSLSTQPPQIPSGQEGGGRGVEPASLWRIMATMVPGPHH